MHPLTLLAVGLLLINDWVLKPRFHGVVTGKLSDIAGLAFAPVVLSSAIGLVLHAAASAGARVDPSLSRRRLLACIAATAVGFTIVKLSPAAADGLSQLLGHLGREASIYLDPTDLLCLPALGIAYFIGRDELRRVPLGKPAAIHRLGEPASPALEDSRWAGGDHARIEDLADAIDAWDTARIDQLVRGVAGP
jgi:hypothetical protein